MGNESSIKVKFRTTQIDRLFDWQRNPNSGVRETLKRQKTNTRDQFDEMVKVAVRQFAEKVSFFGDIIMMLTCNTSVS